MGKKCEACDKETDFFEGADYGNKCIFHCDKSDNAKWGHSDSADVGRFWRAIREQIKNELETGAEKHNFEKYIFPALETYDKQPTSEHNSSIFGHYSHKHEPYSEVEERYSQESKNFWYTTDKSNRAVLKFEIDVSFEYAIFTEKVNFKYVKFNGEVFFDSVEFDIATFNYATFAKDSSFKSARFKKEIEFQYTLFESEANFYEAEFTSKETVVHFNFTSFHGDVNFQYAVFECSADFRNARFENNAYFNNVKFENEANFTVANFNNNQSEASFSSAIFKNITTFQEAKFNSKADFEYAKFESENSKALFHSIIFSNNAIFDSVLFNGGTIFISARFDGEAIFKNTKFEGSISGVSFAKATFTNNAIFEEALFDGEVDFNAVKFEGDNSKILFDGAIFNNSAFFENTSFNGITSFNSAKFKKDVFFELEAANKISLSQLIISQKCEIGSNIKRHINDIKIENITLEDKALMIIYNIKCKKMSFAIFSNKAAHIKLINIKIENSFETVNSIYDKTEFNGVDLSSADSIKLENTSFIGSHLTNIKWGKINENRLKIDRQMARQLKSINDAQGETIIANDFYALEMRLRSKELNWCEHFGEKLVQNIHELISNHSNDWVLATIWFFAFGFLFSTLAKAGLIFSVPFILLLATVGLGVYEADKNLNDYSHRIFASAIFGVSLFCFCLFICDFEFFASLINPLNFKDSKDLLANTNLLLVYSCRLIEVFIGYQIITAIRKNTRRK